MDKVKMKKGSTIKEIPVAYKKAYISAGWVEVKQDFRTKAVGVGMNK